MSRLLLEFWNGPAKRPIAAMASVRIVPAHTRKRLLQTVKLPKLTRTVNQVPCKRNSPPIDVDHIGNLTVRVTWRRNHLDIKSLPFENVTRVELAIRRH